MTSCCCLSVCVSVFVSLSVYHSMSAQLSLYAPLISVRRFTRSNRCLRPVPHYFLRFLCGLFRIKENQTTTFFPELSVIINATEHGLSVLADSRLGSQEIPLSHGT
jgi:hypothetical protein